MRRVSGGVLEAVGDMPMRGQDGAELLDVGVFTVRLGLRVVFFLVVGEGVSLVDDVEGD